MSTTIPTHWWALKYIVDDCIIPDTVQMVHCDTRDFYVFGDTDPDLDIIGDGTKAVIEGVNSLPERVRAKYLIEKSNILPWLRQLCERTGGDKEWRCFELAIENGTNWDLKYIRFIRDAKNPEMFMACNSYFVPICWNDVIPNMKYVS